MPQSMQTRLLGLTGITVSRLCFGTLTIGPWQLGLSPADGGDLLWDAWQLGVRFYDTADLYETYKHLAVLLKRVPRDSVVIATKTYAAEAKEARRDVLRALGQLGTSYVDICLLHEQASDHTLRGHRPALLELAAMREQGIVRAIGLSTHHIAGVHAGTGEPLVQVIHPLLNRLGVGIRDGDASAMLAAIESAALAGKGVYSMKPLGGGHLAGQAEEALAFVRDIPYIHAVALGMGTAHELRFAQAVLSGQRPEPALAWRLSAIRRRLCVEPWCDGCGQCVAVCPQGALGLAGGKAAVDHRLCVLCGYCAASCPGFHLKVVADHGPHPRR
jgi:aryl-alcohol dehydrogenase-like predicted oxidoreductase